MKILSNIIQSTKLSGQMDHCLSLVQKC